MASISEPTSAEGVLEETPPIQRWRGLLRFFRIQTIGFNLLALCLFLLVWQAASRGLRSVFFPTPLVVFNTFRIFLSEGDLQGYTLVQHAYVSLYRVLLGFIASCVTAIPLGIALGLCRPLYFNTRLVTEPLRFIPPLAWIPLAILFFTGLGRYVFLIWVGTFFPLFIITMGAIGSVSPLFVDVGKAFGGSRLFVTFRIVIPSALPQIVGGMRAMMGPAWMCIVAAEMLATEMLGLGQLLFNYASLLRMDVVIVGMVSIGLLGLLLNEIFMAIEKIVFRYREEVKL